MKKTLFFLIAIMAFGLIGCDHTPESNTSKVDVVIIQHGQLQFYDHATQKVTPYEAEKDSVVNVAFDDNNHLYYTSANQQDIKLKMIDLNVKNPQPTLCADWQLTLEQITDEMFDSNACELNKDKSGNLYILNMSFNDEGDELECYNIASGKARTMSYNEYWEQYGSYDYDDAENFYNGDGMFYYVTPEGKYCLTDQMDFMTLFQNEELLRYLHFYPEEISPDGKKVIIKANSEIGELDYGYHCVATLDGKQQNILTDSDLMSYYPKWLSDGSLVYVGEEPRPKDDPYYNAEWNNTRYCIKMLAPDGTTSVLVSDAKQFFFNPINTPATTQQEGQMALEGYDQATFDNGKVTFINSSTNQSIPFDAEKNYVVNGVFDKDYSFYYTVTIGDELYLKKIDLFDYPVNPQLLGDWNLKLSDCYSESCGKVASMNNYDAIFDGYAYTVLTTIEFGLDEKSCEFQNTRYYNGYNGDRTDGWPEQCEERND